LTSIGFVGQGNITEGPTSRDLVELENMEELMHTEKMNMLGLSKETWIEEGILNVGFMARILYHLSNLTPIIA